MVPCNRGRIPAPAATSVIPGINVHALPGTSTGFGEGSQVLFYWIDIHFEVPVVPYKELSTDYAGEKSETIRERVLKARGIQLERFKADKIYCNGQMKTRRIKKFSMLKEDAHSLLNAAMQRLGRTARAYMRTLKVSMTISGLEGSADMRSHYVSEAIQYRTLDRGVF